MIQHIPALIIIVPLLAAFVISIAAWINRKYCYPIALASMVAAFLSASLLLAEVIERKTLIYRLGGWEPPWGIVYHVDFLNGIVLVVVFAVALLNLISARASVEAEFPERSGAFYGLYVLFVTGLSGMVITGDAFNLYVLLEIAALTGYALIGFGVKRAPLSSLNYIFMGTAGASFYLLGIGYLYLATGTLNMAHIASLLPEMFDSDIVLFAFIFCMVGLFIKAALLPLHTWLPNAYSHAPSAAVGLIAPLTTKVMIYVMIRIVLYVFTPDFSFEHLKIKGVMVWLASIAIVVSSLFAFSQKNLKKILCYILIAEVGYMVGGLWLGNRTGITGSVLHIINDSLMTLGVFLAVGNMAFKMQGERPKDLQGLFRKMPFTMAGFAVAGLAIIGVPPTCGFFSKWYLISGGLEAGHYEFVIALILSSLINMVIFFKIFEVAYFEPFADRHGEVCIMMNEAPVEKVAPLMATAGLIIVVGLFTGYIVNHVIRFSIPLL